MSPCGLLLKRGERAREEREGSGLGLPIVSDILTANGSVLARCPGGCEARFVVPGSITECPPPDDTPRRRLARTATAERTGR
jgi:hypothetical protein